MKLDWKKSAAALAVAGSLLGSGVAFAQTSSTTTDTSGTVNTTTSATDPTTTSAPGTPNTGAGGDAASNLLVLATTGVAALAGVAFLARKAIAR
jgi:hypothetical protein